MRMKSGRFHEIRMKSSGFHEIHMKSTPNLVKSEEFLLKHLHLISETSDFMVKSIGFHGFHEICWISWWNPPDFMNVSFWVMIKYRSFYRKTNNKCIASGGASLPKGDRGCSGKSRLEPGTVLGTKSAKRSRDVFSRRALLCLPLPVDKNTCRIDLILFHVYICTREHMWHVCKTWSFCDQTSGWEECPKTTPMTTIPDVKGGRRRCSRQVIPSPRQPIPDAWSYGQAKCILGKGTRNS